MVDLWLQGEVMAKQKLIWQRDPDLDYMYYAGSSLGGLWIIEKIYGHSLFMLGIEGKRVTQDIGSYVSLAKAKAAAQRVEDKD